jgi:DNA repair photolyase
MQSQQPLADLERNLERLSVRGELRQSTIIFGVTTDPFHPFDEKFATSMKFLELFERYSPGKLIIQTRSPLVVIGLPILKKVKNTTFVSIGLETPSDDIRLRYTPQLPSVSERWKTVRALRRFGLKVGIQVAPLLPYGDWRQDAAAFAEDLACTSCRECSAKRRTRAEAGCGEAVFLAASGYAPTASRSATPHCSGEAVPPSGD